MRRAAAISFFAGFLLVGASMAARSHALDPSTSDASESDPAAWKDELQAFEKLDADKAPPQNAALFVGSSSIRLWDLAKSFPEIVAINRGFGGSQICDSTLRADALIVKYNPRLIVFYAGDNDVNSGKSAEQVHVDFAAFVAEVRKSLPKTPIVFISIKPSISRWDQRETQREANRLIAADCEKDETLQFVDVWPVMLADDGEPKKEIFQPDRLHMNDEGYKLWAELLGPVVVSQSPAAAR
jgi:lysophospholipase L1-like esterase